MSINRNRPHLLIYPEDEATDKIVVGALTSLNVDQDKIGRMPFLKGWKKARPKLMESIPRLRKYAETRILFVIDFDNKEPQRRPDLEAMIPSLFADRVYFLGTSDEPEDLRREVQDSLAGIGQQLMDGCPDQTAPLWEHEMLKHNLTEWQRLLNDLGTALSA